MQCQWGCQKGGVPKKIDIFNGICHYALDLPPPLNGNNFHPFLPPFFSFAIESYIYETHFTLDISHKYHFKSSYNWFKIDILRLFRLRYPR